jgi:hypothetical protein
MTLRVAIRPTELHLERGERAFAWFRNRETFEPTAIPAFVVGQEPKILTQPKAAGAGR